MPSVAGYWLSDFCDGIELLCSIVSNFVSLLANISRGTQKDSTETTGNLIELSFLFAFCFVSLSFSLLSFSPSLLVSARVFVFVVASYVNIV